MIKKLPLLLIITFIFASCNKHNNKIMPVPQNGVLDLRNWDLKNDGPVKLDGEWKFFWKKFVPLEDINKEKNAAIIKVPSVWSLIKIKNTPIGRYGYATYHLKILLNPVDVPLAFKFETIGCAYEAYLNGKKINQVGIIGKTFGTMKQAYRPGIADFFDNNNVLELIMYVSNFHQKYSGIWYSIIFGLSKDVAEIRERDILLSIFLVGIFIIMFIYHLSLFLLRRKEKLPLYFSILCLLFAIRIMSFDDILLLNLFPLISMDWLKTIEYITFYMTVTTSCLFMYNFFKEESNKIIFYILNSPIVLVTAITIITPAYIFTFLIPIVQANSLIIFIYIIYINICAIINKREGSIIFLSAIFVLIICASNDILYALYLIDTTNLTQYGLLNMIIFQAYILSTKSARAFTTVENLSVSLDNQIKIRTDKLVAANKEILEINEDLLKTKKQLWSEIEVAKKIQTVLLPKYPEVANFEISTYMLPASQVGGDYYDVINTENNDWIMIGDVSGHGLSAGLIMMMVQSTVRSQIITNPKIKPSELLENINSTISYNLKNMEEQKFMTISALSYNKNDEIILSGRHEDILIYRSENDEVEIIKTEGICISRMALGEKDKNIYLKINKGDTLLLFTDGLTEAWEPNSYFTARENMFGQEKLMSIFQQNGNKSPEEIKIRLLQELQDYILHDDVTLVILKKL